eukprot:scaffold5977_cov103-Isochrysis_galbana.AAC.4
MHIHSWSLRFVWTATHSGLAAHSSRHWLRLVTTSAATSDPAGTHSYPTTVKTVFCSLGPTAATAIAEARRNAVGEADAILWSARLARTDGCTRRSTKLSTHTSAWYFVTVVGDSEKPAHLLDRERD